MININIKGQSVPVLGFGTWQLKGDDAREGVEHALSVGYRHIDTAQAYDNEEFVGRALQNSGVPRDEIFLVSKVNPKNFAREDTLSSTRESLEKLGTHIDLMLMHWPSDDVPHEETLTALREFQDEGSIRHIGVSNFSPLQVEEATQHATIFCNQVEYHPFKQQDELVQQAQEMDYLLTAYSPLDKGGVIDDGILNQIGADYGKSAAQVALRWLVQQQNVCTIPRSSSADHRQANFEVFDFELNADEMARISGMAE